MNKTGIEWADYTWNPVTGCRHGCSYCYARRQCVRFARAWGLDPADPFKPTFHPERDREPLDLAKPSRIFVGSMADLFGDWTWGIGDPDRYNLSRDYICDSTYVIQRILTIIRCCPRHTFIFLTKNPARYRDFEFPKNCWLGVSLSGNDHHGINHSRLVDFARGTENKKNIRFISWEPILDPFFLQRTMYYYLWDDPWFNWLILGAMTGPGAKRYAPRPEWIRDAVDRCRERGIPVFMKNSIRPYWKGELIQEFPR